MTAERFATVDKERLKLRSCGNGQRTVRVAGFRRNREEMRGSLFLTMFSVICLDWLLLDGADGQAHVVAWSRDRHTLAPQLTVVKVKKGDTQGRMLTRTARVVTRNSWAHFDRGTS
jgi:hypothetical protein